MEIFSRCPLIWNSISKTGNIFGIFWALPIDYNLYEKNDARSFCLFVYFQSYNNKSKSFIFINCAVKKQHVLYANKEFLHKVLVLYFSSLISDYEILLRTNSDGYFFVKVGTADVLSKFSYL